MVVDPYTDKDHDNLPDMWEDIVGLNSSKDDSFEDPDMDWLTNNIEFTLKTHPTLNDTDGDSLLDGDEVQLYYTDPLDLDTDDDGFNDGEEIEENTDPLNPNDFPRIETPTPTPTDTENGSFAIISAFSSLFFVGVIFFIRRRKRI